MKKIAILALALPALLNACSAKKSAESAPASAALETDGSEYCSVIAGRAAPTCFLEVKTNGKTEFVTTKSSYEELLLSDSFAGQNVTFKQIDDAEYSDKMLQNVVPSITVKEQELKLVLDPAGTESPDLNKAPGRINSFGSLNRISSSIFKAGSGNRLKSFLRSFTKGFKGGNGKLSPKRLAAGGLTTVAGIFGLIGFGNWAKDKSMMLRDTGGRASLDQEAVSNLEMSVVEPTAYKMEE